MERSEGKRNPLMRLWTKVFTEPFRHAEEESRAYMASEAGKRFDVRTLTVLVVVAISLTLLEYYGMSNRYPSSVRLLEMVGLDGWACRLDAWLDELGRARVCKQRATWDAGPYDPDRSVQLRRLTYWAAWTIFVYVGIPFVAMKTVLKAKWTDFGLSVKGAFRDWWIYALMFAVMAPILWVVSADEHFQRQYPFYTVMPGEALWPRFWTWEFLYLLQFFALEFFFRGFMIHGTKHRLGWYSVVVMTVPYCMIHFGKPMPETFGAIIAGVVLGSLSLKTRSIWLGVAIHASVALSMDFASMLRKGAFG
jgi:membrane protease YdiL (CAAX protease family)